MERCERCGSPVALRFLCLGRRVCFACANAVVRLTRRYPALHEIAASELAESVGAIDRDLRPGSSPGCRRCSATPAPFRRDDGPLCAACARELARAV